MKHYTNNIWNSSIPKIWNRKTIYKEKATQYIKNNKRKLLLLSKFCRCSVTFPVAISLYVVLMFLYVLCCCFTMLYCCFVIHFAAISVYRVYVSLYIVLLCCFMTYIYNIKQQQNILWNRNTIYNETAPQYTMKPQHNMQWYRKNLTKQQHNA